MPGFGDELGRLIPHMRRFARALVRGHSVQVADDLVQETVVMAMRAERLARGPHLRCWCFSALMRAHRQREQAYNTPHPSPIGGHEGGGSAALPGATLIFMPKEIARLDVMPLENREALLLVVLVGMTYAQVAETLHITVETVMARLDIARNVLARGQRSSTTSFGNGTAGTQRSASAAQYLHVVK